MPLVGDIPAKRGEELVCEILPNVGFLVSRREVIPLVSLEVLYQLPDSFECLLH